MTQGVKRKLAKCKIVGGYERIADTLGYGDTGAKLGYFFRLLRVWLHQAK